MMCPKCQSGSLSVIPAEIRLYLPHADPPADDAFAGCPCVPGMWLVGVPDTEFLAFGELGAPNRPTNCSEPCARCCFKSGHVRYVE